MEKIVICALYKFVPLPDFVSLIEPIRATCLENDVNGTLLLAAEGINGTIAGPRAGVDAVLAYLRADPRLRSLEGKESFAAESPFHRLKVRKKREIVTMGIQGIDPTTKVGTYVRPADWNELIQTPDVLLIDTRNDYEYHVGTFEGALNPQTASFTDFPVFAAQQLDPAKHKKIAMFCTGGIRCEKATSLLLDMGFEQVFHLQGGILKYLEDVPQTESRWHGECFVFDGRVTVNHDLQPGNYEMCYACKSPLSQEDMTNPAYREGISCPFCIDTLTNEQIRSFAERQKQVQLARERGEQHIGQINR